MKTLYICRHAKSSWSFNLEDFDRPLGIRGRKDLLKVGDYIKENHRRPDLIISSPASRALYTALFLADAWGYPEEKIQLDPSFYHGTSLTIIDRISTQKVDMLAIFGHNPTLSELAYKLGGGKTTDMPTGSIIGLQFDIDTWKNIHQTKGKPFLAITPKSL